MAERRISVLIPCFNEERSVVAVIKAFRSALPTSTIYVYDNNSTDNTALLAREAGAIVKNEPRPGKGSVVRRMFADVEADIFILVDGDDTYDASKSPAMVELLMEHDLDLINGARVSNQKGAYRKGHRFGNWLLTSLVGTIFGSSFDDMLSGYKVMSRRFVKSFPAMSSGFEIETELAVHALELRVPCLEVPTSYSERGEGSVSKLRTYSDGARILGVIIRLDLPLTFHPAAIRASADFAPIGAGGATADLRSWSGLRS